MRSLIRRLVFGGGTRDCRPVFSLFFRLALRACGNSLTRVLGPVLPRNRLLTRAALIDIALIVIALLAFAVDFSKFSN
ncbi:MAG TPA: hypothetical protein VNY05_01440 [Candidatus Acidoferrales bacterium]|jgi:hypothetical protein|nr:hypothetical protein [Candidatus Acidoferrales bacterium]